MQPEDIKKFPTETKQRWTNIDRLASACIGLRKAVDELPNLIQIEDGKIMNVNVGTGLENPCKYVDEAHKKVIKEIKSGIEKTKQYLNSSCHPNVVLAQAFLIRALQICNAQELCFDGNECALKKYVETIIIEE